MQGNKDTPLTKKKKKRKSHSIIDLELMNYQIHKS